MAVFTYEVLDKDGRAMDGLIEAEDKDGAIKRLHFEGYTILKLHEDRSIFHRRVGLKDLSSFTQRLGVLLKGGLPVHKALSLMESQYQNRRMKTIIERIKDKVIQGSSLSEALPPSIFPRSLISILKAGEAGGILDVCLERFKTYADRSNALKNRIRHMMIYPCLMSIVVMGTLIFISIFLIPRITLLYNELETTLPLPTQILITLSLFISKFWWIPILLVSLFTILIRYIDKEWIDKLKLRIPILGELLEKVEMIRFSLVVGMLLKSGVSLIEAISITKEALMNRYISSKLDRIEYGLKEGKGIAHLLREEGLSPSLVEMISCGEEVGMLDKMFLEASSIYEEEVEDRLKVLTSMIEPMMVIVMGIVVGFIVIAMLLPLFSLRFLV